MSTSRDALPPPDEDALRIVGCTCSRVRRLARRITQVYDRALAPAGLRVTQYSLLSQLFYRDALPMSTLAGALDMDRTTLTRNLKPLLAAGLVEMGADTGDARVRSVHLTDAGRTRRVEARRLWRGAQDDINRRLGHAQVATLHALSDGLLERFNAE